MRLLSRYTGLAAALLSWGCQSNTTSLVSTLPPPQNLAYQLDPSGDPAQPAGILLVWDDVQSSALGSYRIYSHGSTSSPYGLRGETSSNTFHDNGVPHLQYYVTAADVNGGESDPSNIITVDERLQLPQPASLTSISLNQAIHLEFLATLLVNGVPRCFGVSAISVEGYESLWSPLWHDTPRPDARNVLVSAYEVSQSQSGFRFWNDANGNGKGDPGELGLVQDGNRTDIDFWVHLQASDSTLWIVPEFAGDSLQLYDSTHPVADLTSIDFAPASGYTRNMIQAVPGYGYVFQRNENGQYHYAALRVTAVGRQYVIFDWSAQTDPGNPELVVMQPALAARVTGSR